MSKNQDNSVVERRLRPIYEWLDIGNNKKALQECEKVLKKTPNLQCAIALKAFTLYRIGRESEALQILEALSNEQPTDDATLQAMTLCYRELQQLEKICKLYETATKVDPSNEELQTHLFMSYARIFDFKSQQKTAMTLYKHKPKTPYYCWAVMSIILQATRGENDLKKRQLLLSLAERMMEKLIVEGKLDAEQEVQLYIMVLELQGKFEEILVILKGPLGLKLNCTNLPQNKIKYLKHLERWLEINTLCKGVLVDCVDRWDIWKEYINSVFCLMEKPQSENNHSQDENDLEMADDTPEKCHEFICRIVENGAENGFLLRGPYLARFELCRKLTNLNLDSNDVIGDVIELFIEYFRKFSHKPCCVSDLKGYLNLLDAEKQSELAVRLTKDVGISGTIVPQSEHQMQRHLCAIQLSRLCSAHRHLSAEHIRALIVSFSLHYEHGYQAYGTNLLSTDLGPSDPYLLLAAHLLYDLAQLEKSSESIIAALVLLENLLKNSPSNFHAKLLCLRLYHTIGGVLGAQNIYISLDMKHLQLDSLGFVHCARLPTFGVFSLWASLFDTTLKFFSANYKDSSDHITYSYKYGSFIKLDEFMDFRERLNNSLHYTTVAVDRIILSLIECTNLETLNSVDLSPKDNNIDWAHLRDNHDLSVYLSWDPERITCPPEDDPEITRLFQQNITYLKLRTFPIFTLANCIDIIKTTDGVRKIFIENLKSGLGKWEELWIQCKKMQNKPIRQHHITLPLPSRLHVNLATPYFEVIGGFLKLFVDLASNGVRDGLLFSVEESLKKIEGRKGTNNLIERRDDMEYFVNVVEIFSLSSIVCLLCSELIKSTQTKRSKKKMSDTSLSHLSDVLKTSISRFLEELQVWSEFSVSSDLSTLFESLNVNNGQNSKVCESVTDSYVTAGREIQSVLKNKLKVLNSIS